ncbi:MAG: 3,4-dihydroxy-2-butanone-4-phosphate synthase [Fibrobacteria bacterium]|nr:3,4-dihydroxy-2-butanone-4-phosphate synthase [Fibrobacteria bacterium]
MTQSSFFDPVERSIEAIREGRMCIVCDDEDRENEGDLVGSAQSCDAAMINFMATHGRGLICCSLTEDRARQLELPMMTRHNTAPLQTAFTVSVEARVGTTTGISAADRARTVQVLVDPSTTRDDLVTPGHMFPLVARDGGVLVRSGQTEASVDLARLAGHRPAGVICEIMGDDGTMMRVPALREFADRWNMPMCSVADLIEYRRRNEVLVSIASQEEVTWEGRQLRIVRWRDQVRGLTHTAVVSGEISTEAPVAVRVQAENPDAGWDLARAAVELRGIHAALDRVAQGGGVFLYLQALPAPGEDRPELPPIGVGHEESPRWTPDRQTLGIGAQILWQTGVRRIVLLTNKPRRIVGLQGYGLTVEGHEPFGHAGDGEGDFLDRFLSLFG